MCVSVGGGGVTIRKRQKNWDDEGRENEGREVEGVGINLGGLKQLGKKFQYHLFMFVENGFEIVTTIV